MDQNVASWGNDLPVDFLHLFESDNEAVEAELPRTFGALERACLPDFASASAEAPVMGDVQHIPSAANTVVRGALLGRRSSRTGSGGISDVVPSSTGRRGIAAAASSDSETEEADVKTMRTSNKRPREVVTKNKACREKARREKINDRFMELAKLLEPGKEPKVDKSTILSDAIKFVQQQNVENSQLKQLNKFLEERIAQFERERGQQLYQMSLVQPQAGSHLPIQQTMMIPQALSFNLDTTFPPIPSQHLPSHGMQQQQDQQEGQLATLKQEEEQQLVDVPMLLPAAMPLQFSFMPMLGKSVAADGAMPLQHNPYWLPVHDSAQDALLRPPAA